MTNIAPAVRWAEERLGSIEPLLAMPENECAHGWCDGDRFPNRAHPHFYPPCDCRRFVVEHGCEPAPVPDLMSTFKAAKEAAMSNGTTVTRKRRVAKRKAQPGDELIARVVADIDAEIARLKRARQALAKLAK